MAVLKFSDDLYLPFLLRLEVPFANVLLLHGLQDRNEPTFREAKRSRSKVRGKLFVKVQRLLV